MEQLAEKGAGADESHIPGSSYCRRREAGLSKFGGFLLKVAFSLADGSALIKGLRRLGFRWIPRHWTQKIIVATLIAWAPLLILSAYEGFAWGNKVQIPFLVDMVQYARFLVALPCAIALGEYVNPRLEAILNSFLKSGIVLSKDFPSYENAISRARVLTSSIIPELVILALVYAYASLGLQREGAAAISSWNHPGAEASMSTTAASLWFLFVSMPLLLFTWFLWVWRLCVWAYLLFQISRLDLRVVATHPDCGGGLNFVHVGMRRFSVLFFGISSILSASIGEEIVFSGASLHSYELELAVFFFICLAVILGPVLVFTPILIRSKLEYWGKYAPLASDYVQGFDAKWIEQKDYATQRLLGSSDIQSLADLRHSYAGIAEMRTVLANKNTVAIFAFAYVVPTLPLLASVISLRRILSEVYSLLLK